MDTPDYVWYAAYGSNLSAERFAHYITGGKPEGASRVYGGARDHEPPTGDRPAVLDYRMYFGGESSTWGGGAVAFIDPDNDAEQRTLARLYRISWEQLEDVIAQENGEPRGSVRLDGDVLELGQVEIDAGWYRVVLLVAHEWGERMLVGDEYAITVTAPPGRLDYATPTDAYLRHLVTGLRESHELSDERILDYLFYRPGIKGRSTREHLAAVLR